MTLSLVSSLIKKWFTTRSLSGNFSNFSNRCSIELKAPFFCCLRAYHRFTSVLKLETHKVTYHRRLFEFTNQGLFQTFVGCDYCTQSSAWSFEKKNYQKRLKMRSVQGLLASKIPFLILRVLEKKLFNCHYSFLSYFYFSLHFLDELATFF